jgi:hypothetical protein
VKVPNEDRVPTDYELKITPIRAADELPWKGDFEFPVQLLQLTEVIDQDATVSHLAPPISGTLVCSRDPEKRPAMSAGPSETAEPRFPNCFVTGEPMGEPARHRRRAYRHPADRAPCLYSATPSLTCQHTIRAVPLSLKISPLKRNTFPGAIALEFSICVLLST